MKIAITLIVTMTIFVILVIAINAIFDMQWLQMYSTCMDLHTKGVPVIGIPTYLIFSFFLISNIFTFVADIQTFLLIRRYNNESSLPLGEDGHIKVVFV